MSDRKSQITWTALSHSQYKRSSSWYLGFILISAALILYAIFVDHNILTLVMFGLMIIIVFTFSLQKPVKINYKLTKLGVHADEAFYPYSIIKKFWIIYQPPLNKSVNFKTTAYINNNLRWDLADQNPVEIKQFLAEHIDEDLDQREGLSEALARSLKI